MAGESRNRMVESAMRLFQRQGYEATTWRQIAADGGAPTGSIGFLFPGGKEELGVAAVQASAAQTRELLVELCGRGGPAAPIVQAWIRASAAAFADSDYTEGCPLATVALEMAHRSPRIRDAAGDGFDAWRAVIADRLRAELGDDADDAAEVLMSAFEGAMVLARARRTTQPFDVLADRTPRLLAAFVAT